MRNHEQKSVINGIAAMVSQVMSISYQPSIQGGVQ